MDSEKCCILSVSRAAEIVGTDPVTQSNLVSSVMMELGSVYIEIVIIAKAPVFSICSR